MTLAQLRERLSAFVRNRKRVRRAKHHAAENDLGYVRERLGKLEADETESIKDTRKRIRRKKRGVPGVEDGGWHPDAIRTQVRSGIGSYLNVPAKLVWHTTEGSSLPSYSGSHPHFTLDPRTGRLYQHISIRSGAMALKNLSGGVETNRAHAIQVELIGFARDTPNWPDSHYAQLAKLARWIEKHAGVKRASSVTFSTRVNHLSGQAWLDYAGHVGHQHVPENDHWDPGALRIGKVIQPPA